MWFQHIALNSSSAKHKIIMFVSSLLKEMWDKNKNCINIKKTTQQLVWFFQTN